MESLTYSYISILNKLHLAKYEVTKEFVVRYEECLYSADPQLVMDNFSGFVTGKVDPAMVDAAVAGFLQTKCIVSDKSPWSSCNCTKGQPLGLMQRFQVAVSLAENKQCLANTTEIKNCQC